MPEKIELESENDKAEQKEDTAALETLAKIKEKKDKDPIRTAGILFPEFTEKLRGEGLDLIRQAEEIKKFIKEQTPETILLHARKRYQAFIEENNLVPAYEIAKSYLDKESIETAARQLFAQAVYDMNEAKSKTAKITAAQNILSPSFAPEAERPSEMIEKALETQFQLRDKRARVDETKFYARKLNTELLRRLVSPIKNKNITEAARFTARGEIFDLMRSQKSREAAELAQLYTDRGLLSYEGDTDLLDKLTE